MITFLSSPSVWKGLFKKTTLPWKFVILGCAGGASYARTLSLPPLKLSTEVADSVKDSGTVRILPDDALLEIPSLHLIGQRDQWRSDGEEVCLQID